MGCVLGAMCMGVCPRHHVHGGVLSDMCMGCVLGAMCMGVCPRRHVHGVCPK